MFDTLGDANFTIVSVAMDADVEAARPWVAEASPAFVTLIDQNHVLSSLYNMVNVPQAVWIDEDGLIVRPTHTGGSLDILREFDFEAGGFPEEATARAQAAKAAYVDAVRDWAVHGAASRYALDSDTARNDAPVMTAAMAEAHAWFQLGQHLARAGRGNEADVVFARCRELHPDSWNIFRQTTEKVATGIAAGEAFWAKVMALGDKAYYDPVKL